MPLYTIDHLSSAIKTELLKAYNDYIQEANEQNRYAEGWYPVCVEEFLNAEFREILEGRGMIIVPKIK